MVEIKILTEEQFNEYMGLAEKVNQNMEVFLESLEAITALQEEYLDNGIGLSPEQESELMDLENESEKMRERLAELGI